MTETGPGREPGSGAECSLLAGPVRISAIEAADPYCLGPGEAAKLLTGHPWRRFVVLGDSVAAGVSDPVPGYPRLPFADRIGAELAGALRPDEGVADALVGPIVGAALDLDQPPESHPARPRPAGGPVFAYRNLGRTGLRAAAVRAGQLAAALAFAPDLALVVCGGNDAFPRTYRPAAVDTDLESMVAALRATAADVITVGMFDVSHSPAVPAWLRPGLSQRMHTLSRRTAAIGARYGTIHVSLTTHPASADPGIYSADGRHGNDRSHAIAAAETVRALAAALLTAA